MADAYAYLSPCNVAVTQGMTFTLDLRVNSGTNQVVGQQSYITFTNSLLQVIPPGGTCGTSSTTVQGDTSTFEVALQNTVNNSTGEIAYASGTFGAGAPPGSDFRVARITFCATSTGVATIHWQFSPPAPVNRNSKITDVDSNVVSNPALYQDCTVTVRAVNHPPYFVYPPTPPDGTTFTVIAGNNISFDVRAQDDDVADTVTLGAVGLPSGASFPIPATGNPVQSTFSWTPTNADSGPHVINSTATDQSTAQAFTSVTVIVIPTTSTPTATYTRTNTPTSTPTSSNTPTNTPTDTYTNTPTTSPTNTPPCPTDTPVVVVTPAYTPLPGCSSTPDPGVVTAVITDHPATVSALFTNHSTTCSYPIGLASYRMFDANQADDALYDYSLAIIPPNSSLTLTVNKPTCAYEAYAFYGNLIVSFSGGQSYGTRALDYTSGNTGNYCTSSCQPSATPTVTLTPTVTRTPTRTRTATPTATPCDVCYLYYTTTTISCNPDGTVHWTFTIRKTALALLSMSLIVSNSRHVTATRAALLLWRQWVGLATSLLD